ncbi:MAG: cyclic nucleotide-binding domain-containing protein [Desulfobacterales bacterium]|nr:cyclic nucleotide-binding domain-containing protein [Desulfobacterales bacterium]
MTTDLMENKAKVQRLIDQKRKDEAVALLFDMVVACSKAKKFQEAEELRQQIMEVNSLALNEIIKAAEIIESEKAKSIDQYHKRVWHAIYTQLSEEEANDLYFSLKKIDLSPDKMIIQQGRVNNRLFFVDAGVLRVFFEKDNKEMFLKETGKGEPVGFKSFFNISYATVTIMTKGPVTFHYLERKQWDQLVKKHPGLDGKLETICASLIKNKIEDILENKSAERRQYDRFRLNGKAAVHIIKADGQPAQFPFYGMLEDISQGGLSFSFRKSTRETARMLLGQQAQIKIQTDDAKDAPEPTGRIISVHNQLFNEYLVNFKFHKPIPAHTVMELASPKH